MAEPKIEPIEETPHIASGENLEPHASNPESVRQTAERAMKEAMEKAAESADDNDGTDDKGEDPIDWEKIKGAAASTSDKDTDQTDGEGEDDSETDIGDLEPLSIWNAEQQDTFRQLERDAQQYLLDATAAATAPIQSQLDALQPCQRLNDQWQPYFEKTLNGVPVQNAVESLLNADMILRTGTQQQKVDLLRKLAHDYGVTAQPQQQQMIPEDLADDPVAKAMAGPLQNVVNELNSLKQQINTQSQSFTDAQRQQGQAQVDAFAAATDDQGNPKHPYFKEVETLMEDLAEIANRRGQSPTLEQLYDQACAATPEVRAKMQSAQKAADIIERKKAAAARKQAASSVSGSPSGARSVDVQINPDEPAEDTVRNAMIAHGLIRG